MKIKAVLFDLGNTLVYSHPEKTFQKILRKKGLDKPINQVREAIIRGNKEFDIDKHTELHAHEFYTQWNMVELKHLGIIGAEARKLAEEINTEWFENGRFYLFPGVKRILRSLRQMGLKLGIITGGYVEDIESILPKVRLEAFFDVYVGVNTVGKRKPHSKAFKYALQQLAVKPEEAIFVGDDFEADYLGAMSVGIVPVLIKWKTPKLISRCQVDSPGPNATTIYRLDEIFTVLKEINR